MMSNKTTIGVFFGARSPEHDVSIITACRVIRGLREMGFSVVPVYVAKDGRFFLGEDTDDPGSTTLARVDFFEDNLEETLASLPEYDLAVSQLSGKLRFVTEGMFSITTVDVKLAFPCFHGPHGEDGALHGLFDTADIPYVGCDLGSSVVAMDKARTKLLYRQFDIPTTDFIYITSNEWEEYKGKVLNDLQHFSAPLFVKPARAGSSIGITRVSNLDELEFAINTAFSYDSKVVVEEGVENVADLTVALRGDQAPEASLIQESRFEDDFFSYTDKYISDGGAQIGGADKKTIIPADIDDATAKEVVQLAKEIFTQFELSGIARVDFLLDRDTDKIFANEINTMPGTLYKHLWEESGVSFTDLLRSLVRNAKARHDRKQEISYTFDSPILEHAGDGKLGGKEAGHEEVGDDDKNAEE